MYMQNLLIILAFILVKYTLATTINIGILFKQDIMLTIGIFLLGRYKKLRVNFQMNFSIFLNGNSRKLPKICVNFSTGYLVKVWHAKFHVPHGLIGFEKNPSCAYNGNCFKKLSVVMNSFKKWLDFFRLEA